MEVFFIEWKNNLFQNRNLFVHYIVCTGKGNVVFSGCKRTQVQFFFAKTSD